MVATLPFKRCTRCLLDKLQDAFYRDKTRRDGHSARCKDCHALPPLHQTLEQRFWSKVHKTTTCWLWIAAKWPNGYGHFVLRTHHALAHRVAWELIYGPIPEGLEVLHDCPEGDNKACVNPAHLWLGTHTENYYDALDKGQLTTDMLRRRPSKLNESQCQELIALYATGEWTATQLAKRYGVHRNSINYRIQNPIAAHKAS